MIKPIGYARVSARIQDAARQVQELLVAGVRRDDLYIDHVLSSALARRPGLDEALDALHPKDTLVITTLDRFGLSTQKMLELAKDLRERNVGLRVLNLGGEDVDTKTPMGAMLLTVMVALAQMELEIKREHINDSVTKRRTTGGDLGGRRPTFTESQVHTAAKFIQAGEPATQVAKDMGMSRATLYRRIKALN